MAVSGIYVTRGACLRYSPGMALIGYGRVSKRDQDPTAQRDLLTAAGCDELFIDKASGKLASRPQLDAAMRHLRAGDVLVITRLDRLGRSVKHLAALAVELQERKIGLRVLQQGIDTTTAVGRLFFHILAAIAEFERELIIERTVDGLDATRARGRKGGRKPTLTEAAVHQAQAMYLDFRTWLVVGGRHGMGGSPDAGRFLPALEEVAPQLCVGHEVEVVRPDGALQRGEDGCCVVVGALDEEGLAVAPEADGARAGPRPQMPSGCLEARSGLEAEAPRIGNRSEHQVTGQLHRRLERWGLIGGEVGAGELGRAAFVGDAWADHVLDSQAPDVNQPAADTHPAVALLARDQHAHQALGAGIGDIDVGPLGVAVDGAPLAPPRTHPAPDELAFSSVCLVGCGDGPDQGSDRCRRHAKGTGNLLWGMAACAQHAHASRQLLAVHAGVILPTGVPDHLRRAPGTRGCDTGSGWVLVG